MKYTPDLNMFFTNHQIEIMFKRANNHPLTKTEREMYSQIKKRLKAIVCLHHFILSIDV